MSDDSGAGANGGGMRAVTISREYGSGGGEIAGRLAARLGWRLVDHELVVRLAHALGETEAEAAALDEHAEGFLWRMLEGLRYVSPWTMADQPRSLEEQHRRHRTALASIIDAAAALGEVVIVGRGAQAILAKRRDVLQIRIVAPLAARIAYVVRRENLTPDEARARILTVDRDRARYLQEAEHARPDDAHLYDLTINTGVLSLDDAVDLIVLALRLKARRLHVSAEELGPGVALPPYPGPPQPFVPEASPH
ncbi:MAG TPA: cytidylate kinase-like family protein [Thermomicrobiales bacterium]|nr:cytidylate kinase-like family protein [Thermomicrobiales bacterium]